MKAETIQSDDGTQLSSRVCEPDSPDRGSVVISGAMGVRRHDPPGRVLQGMTMTLETSL